MVGQSIFRVQNWGMQRQHLAELDWLRGFAALSVLFFHFFFKAPSEAWVKLPTMGWVTSIAGYAYLGVNLFFVISGFVIAQSATHSSSSAFAKSRLIRLLPALWVCATLTLVAIYWVPASTLSSKTPWLTSTPILSWFASLSLIPEWFGIAAIDGVYWSLRVEVQFYLFVFILLAFGRLHWAKACLAILWTLSAINLFKPMFRLQFILILDWVPYLAAGVLFFKWHSEKKLSRETCIGLLVSLLLALGYAYRSAVKDGYEIPWISCSLVAGIFALFIWICNRNAVVQRTRLSDWLGALTYPLYLIHQVVGYLIIGLILHWLPVQSQLASMALLLLVSLMMIGVATLIHQVIEQPAQRWLKSKLLRNKTV